MSWKPLSRHVLKLERDRGSALVTANLSYRKGTDEILGIDSWKVERNGIIEAERDTLSEAMEAAECL